MSVFRRYMDDNGIHEKTPPEIAAICAMNSVLHTEGVAEMAYAAGMPPIGKERAKGVKLSENKNELTVDVYLNVSYGTKIPETAWNVQKNVKKKLEEITEYKVAQVNIHIMGVSTDENSRKGRV